MGNKRYFNILKYAIIGYIAVKLIDTLNIAEILKSISEFIVSLFSAFSVVLIGFVIAYIIDPIVSLICRKTIIKSRLSAVWLAYIIIGTLLGGFIFYAVIKINSMGGTNIGENIILIINRSVDEFTAGCIELARFISRNGFSAISADILSEITLYATSFIRYIGRSFTDIVGAAGSIAFKIFIGFVAAFYFLKDKEKIKTGLDEKMTVIFPKFYGFFKCFLKDVNTIFSSYFRGQLTDSLILAVIISISLSIAKISFAVPIGIISGFLNIIPYIGAITGFVLALIGGIISGSVKKAVIGGIIIIAAQQVDSLFLSPKIVGKSVDLNPVVIIVVLIASGNLFGIIGMFFAVPVTALIKHIFYKYYYNKKSEKNKA